MDPRMSTGDPIRFGLDLRMPLSGGPPGYVLPQHSRCTEHLLSHRGHARGRALNTAFDFRLGPHNAANLCTRAGGLRRDRSRSEA